MGWKKTKQIIIPSSQLDEQTELLECSLNSSITHQKPNREREEKKKNVVSRMWWSQMQKPANYAMSLMRWKKVADTTFWLDNSVCLCSGLQVRNKGTCINAQWLIEHEKKNTADTVLKNQCSNDKINTRKSKPWIIHKKEMRHRTEVEKKGQPTKIISIFESELIVQLFVL